MECVVLHGVAGEDDREALLARRNLTGRIGVRPFLVDVAPGLFPAYRRGDGDRLSEALPNVGFRETRAKRTDTPDWLA